MTANSSGEHREKPISTTSVPQRLRFDPSGELLEALRPFYRPSATDKLAKLALWSTAYLPAELGYGGNLIYEDPTIPYKNSGDMITRFNQLEQSSPPHHTYPLLSYVQYEMRDQKRRLRVNLRLGTQDIDVDRFAMIPGFASQLPDGYADVFFDIKASDFVPSRDLGRQAIYDLNNLLGINHPARSQTPPARRFVDPDKLYAVRDPGFRHSIAVDPILASHMVVIDLGAK